MTKILTLLAGATLAPALLLAQSAQHGWIAAPGALQKTPTEGQQGPVFGKPFSGTEVRRSVQMLSDGTRVEKSDSSAYYRDDKGRVRSEGKNIAMIFDPVAGFNYQLDKRTKTYARMAVDAKANYSIAVIGDGTWTSSTTMSTTGNVGHGTMIHSRTLNGRPVIESKPVTEDLRSQMINGVLARGSRITTTIPIGAFGNDREMRVVNERWSSDDLRVLVKSVNSDPRFGESTYELTNVVMATPDPALFMVPADFTQRDAAAHEVHPQHTVHHE